jgi:HAD superfamily hydrolase (TIGR01509 family)
VQQYVKINACVRQTNQQRYDKMASAGKVYVSVFSAEEGRRKPAPEIYRRALSLLSVAPQEAIYVDDRLKNVQGARQVGMHALHFTDSVGIRQEIRRLLALARETYE